MHTGTHVCFLLDRSGSMDKIKQDVVKGFNQYIETLKKISTGDLFLTLILFDKDGQDLLTTQVVYDRRPVEEIPPLEEYAPRGWTPLYDAIGHAIHHAEKAPADRVLVVILTDGQENSSLELDRAAVAKMIEEREAEGWTFVYLGANQDAFREAQKISIPAGQAIGWAANPLGVAAAFTTTAHTTTAYYQQVPQQPISPLMPYPAPIQYPIRIVLNPHIWEVDADGIYHCTKCRSELFVGLGVAAECLVQP